jgi:hypothetical protein
MPERPRKVPDDIRERVIAELKRRGAAYNEAAADDLKAQTVLLPRLEKGIVVRRSGVLIPKDPTLPVNFPSDASKREEIERCKTRISEDLRIMNAWDKQDLDVFAPELIRVDALGSFGRLPGGRLSTVQVLDKHSAVITFSFPDPNDPRDRLYRTVLMSGVDTSKLANGLSSPFGAIVVVVGSEEIGSRTYPVVTPFTSK